LKFFFSYYLGLLFLETFSYTIKKGIGRENVLIVGNRDIAERLELALYDFDRFRFLIKGKISENITVNDVEKFIQNNRIDTVFLLRKE